MKKRQTKCFFVVLSNLLSSSYVPISPRYITRHIILPQKTYPKYNQSYEVDPFCRPVWLTAQQVRGNYLIGKR